MGVRTARVAFLVLAVTMLLAVLVARRSTRVQVDEESPSAPRAERSPAPAVSVPERTTAAAGNPEPGRTVRAADDADLPVLRASAPAVIASGWLNTDPIGSAELAGKVVLYDFWTFGCVNCRNTLPWVKAWHARYADDGLLLLSVHTPEFAYEADPAAVARFVREEAISYPVALDPEKRTWRAFENHYWPAFYLHDARGRRRYVHYGEGRYQRTEDAIRSLLGVEPDAPRAVVPQG